MSQTYHFSRVLNCQFRGHRHKLHFIVLEDCDADDDGDECERAVDDQDGEAIFEAIKKAIGFEPERAQ